MDRKVALISALSDGQWHSGETLAALLGISRAAVWKRLKGLEGYGLQIESLPGKGYRLAQPLELLEAGAIHAGDAQVVVLSETDSTNRYVSDHAASGELHPPAVCFAEYQSAGRGRRGRQWQSPFGANLYCSMLWHFNEMPPDLPALSLAVGVSLADCMSDLSLQGVGLKWPNDLLADGRKLGGILIEHRGESGGHCQIIVGVGLNYAMSAAQAAAVDQPWTSYVALATGQDRKIATRNQVAAALTSELLDCLTLFDEQGFAPFRERWAKYDIAQGKAIRIEHDGRWQDGEALGIDRDGALLVRMRGERRRFISGEISLRVAEEAGESA